MNKTFKIHIMEAYKSFSEEINQFGAMFLKEAEKQFASDFVESAIRRRIIEIRATSVGQIIFLRHQGRVLVGLRGSANPSNRALENSVCLRQAVQITERKNYTLSHSDRRYSRCLINTSGNKIIVFARSQGYSWQGLREIKYLILSGEYDQAYIFSYIPQDALDHSAATLFQPTKPTNPAVTHQQIILKSIKPLH